jgi:polyhydroxyalkanoic acid synthase PhaR subunit
MSRTQENAGPTNSFDPFGQWKALRESNLDAWSKVMVDFVNSDAYARASAQWLDTYMTMSQSFQQVIDQAMTQTLSQYNMPSTADIERLAERLTNVELRLDDLDARLDEMLRLLRGLTDAAVTTQRAVEKAEHVAERAERAAGDAGRAAQHAAEAAEKAVERVSQRVEQAIGEAGQAAHHAAEAAERVAAAAETPAKESASGPAARPAESRVSTDSKRQERK